MTGYRVTTGPFTEDQRRDLRDLSRTLTTSWPCC
ncbi:hypothetical protein FHU30_003215 [Actinomadura rupiterrae]|nr:hypothetical protein [Actinomadura rupiterrae]